MLPTDRNPTKQEIEAEIESLAATVNALPVKLGVKLLKRVAVLTKELKAMA